MWSKGFAAEETKAAFARAAELAAQERRLLGAFRGGHGQWTLAHRARRTAVGARAGLDVPAGSRGSRARHGSRRRPPRPRLDQLLFRRFCGGANPLRAGACRLLTPSMKRRRENASASTPAPWRLSCLATDDLAIGRGRPRARTHRDREPPRDRARPSPRRWLDNFSRDANLEILRGDAAAALSAAEALEALQRESMGWRFVACGRN